MKKIAYALLAVIMTAGFGLAGALSAQATESQPYTIVAWSIDSGSTASIWPQTLALQEQIATKDVNALDGKLLCGYAYQIDVYNTGSKTDALLAGGILTAPSQPLPEDHVSPGLWKYVVTPDCADATASATVTGATCSSDSVPSFSIENAAWEDSTDVTDGSRVANADARHTFSDGTNQTVVTYDVVPALTGDQCNPPPSSTPSPPPTQELAQTGPNDALRLALMGGGLGLLLMGLGLTLMKNALRKS